MKYRNVLLIVAVLVMCSGCLESVTLDQVDRLTGNVQEVMLAIDNVQEALAESEVLDKERVDKLNEELDRVQPQIAEIVEAVKDSKGGLDTLVAANNASAPINPYYPIIAAGLSVVGLIKRDRDARTVGKKYKAHKQGAEKFMREASNASDVNALYVDIGEARRRNGIT